MRLFPFASVSLLIVSCKARAPSQSQPTTAVSPPAAVADSPVGQGEVTSPRAPEPAAVRRALDDADALLEEAKKARDAKDMATARAKASGAIDLLVRADPGHMNRDIGDRLFEMGRFAHDAGALRDAREAGTSALAQRESSLPEDHPYIQEARQGLAATSEALGDLQGARALLEKVLEVFSRTLPEDHPDLQNARSSLALVIGDLGDVRRERELLEKVLAVREKTLPADHPDLLKTRLSLATVLRREGDPRGARAMQEDVLAAFERTFADEDPDLQKARLSLAVTLTDLGDAGRARELIEKVIAIREQTLPEESPDLQAARRNLAVAMQVQGDLLAARTLGEKILAIDERTLPDDHPSLQKTRHNLAATVLQLGDTERARELEEKVLATYEKTLPEEHPDLQKARQNLSIILREAGDLEGARRLEEKALAVLEKTRPDDNLDLQRLRLTHSETVWMLGDFQTARATQEKVLAVFEKALPGDHSDVQGARLALAVTKKSLGDLHGARALMQEAVAGFEKSLPEDHSDLLDAQQDLAATIGEIGDLEGERVLEEKILALREKSVPDDHPAVQTARQNLAVTLALLGEHEAARALEEKVLAVREKTLADDHPDLLAARMNLAATLEALGDLTRARSLEADAVAIYENTFPTDHPDLQGARQNLAWTLARLSETKELSAVLGRIADGLETLVNASLSLSPREALERTGSVNEELGTLLSLAPSCGDTTLDARAFALIEQIREKGRSISDLAGAADPILAPLLARARQSRQRLDDLVAGAASAPEERPRASAEIATLVRKRDDAERGLRAELTAAGRLPPPIDAKAIARSLPARSCAIGFRRYRKGSLAPDAPRGRSTQDAMLAYVIGTDGGLRRIELGPIDAIEKAVDRWRASVGEPVAARGVSGRPPGTPPGPARTGERQAGQRLRRLVLDPVLAATGDAVGLYLCPDDALHLVPIDALPLGEEPGRNEEGLVGERYAIHVLSSFGPLLSPRETSSGPRELLALGGIDYDASDVRSGRDPADVRLAPIEAASADGARSGMGDWSPLPGSLAEVQAIASVLERTGADRPILLTGSEATKAAFLEHAPKARWLHIATHGWFAPESVRSAADPQPEDRTWRRASFGETVLGLAPMAVCGLALAGANRGEDSHWTASGVITAEEIAGLDLAGCDLAVLSACETNVGITRAGQGIQSLQAALHAAGVGTAITSLWKVDDERARELFEDFYSRVWVRGQSKAAALWAAKMALRKKGAPTQDWAAWVLTGEPN